MSRFRERVTVRLGETAVVISRLTLKEVRDAREAFRDDGETFSAVAEGLIREHVRLEDGGEIDPSELTLRQMQTLVTELVGVPEGSGLSDFIGLLC